MEWGPKFQAEVRSKSERKDHRLAREERASSQASTLTLTPEPLAVRDCRLYLLMKESICLSYVKALSFIKPPAEK